MTTSLNRRDFLTYSGATIAGITLGEAGRRMLARADERSAAFVPHTAIETWATSVCRECPAACGVRVRLMDGAPVKIEGNPNCPVARGRLCAKGQAAIEGYYDPDRLVGPARRVGRRGENRWSPVGWPEATAILASHLKDAGAIVALAADERGPIADVWARFWTARHARVAWTLPATAERLAPSFRSLTGATGDPVFDLERATHVLSFAAPLVDDWLSPVWSQRSYGRFRRGASRPRGRLVQIDERRSLTARKADEWLPIAADRQSVLAYGIASVLLREDRVDRGRLNELSANVAEFEAAVVAHYTPDVVALATGVPVVTLLRLAREFAASPQPLAVTAADAPRALADAAFALNALVGALDRPGGVFAAPGREQTSPPLSAFDAMADLAASANASTLVALRDASALRSIATPVDLDRTLARCGFIVSFSPYLDEAAAAADLLLPTHTPLESWHALVPPTADGTDKVACARPTVAPRLETRDLVSVLRAGAEASGAADAASMPESSEGAVQPALDRVWNLRRGAPYATGFETSWVRQLERGGWWVPPAASAEEFGRTILEAGGWVDPYLAAGQLRQAIAQRGGLTFAPPPAAELDAAVPSAVATAMGDGAPAEPASTTTPTLRLVTFTPSTVNLAGGPNQPVLFELLGQPDNLPWRVWAELNPETGRRLGIAAGATIRISSAAGSIDAVAALVEHAPANTVAVAYVPIVHGGRWAQRMDADVRRLWQPGGAPDSITVRVTTV